MASLNRSPEELFDALAVALTTPDPSDDEIFELDQEVRAIVVEAVRRDDRARLGDLTAQVARVGARFAQEREPTEHQTRLWMRLSAYGDLAELFRRRGPDHAAVMRCVSRPALARVVRLLARDGPLRPVDLTESCGVTKGVMTKWLAELEELGLVGRERLVGRRSSPAFITLRGRRVVELLPAEEVGERKSASSLWDQAGPVTPSAPPAPGRYAQLPSATGTDELQILYMRHGANHLLPSPPARRPGARTRTLPRG